MFGKSFSTLKTNFRFDKRTASVVKQTNEAQPKDLPTQTVDKPFG
ncbi:hypothetical protein P7266_1674 [Lactococcus cremoris]|nr:hypothetical protein P7266_1674 [Lactococcus cremoris]